VEFGEFFGGRLGHNFLIFFVVPLDGLACPLRMNPKTPTFRPYFLKRVAGNIAAVSHLKNGMSFGSPAPQTR
jgi:hypothetical protein